MPVASGAMWLAATCESVKHVALMLQHWAILICYNFCWMNKSLMRVFLKAGRMVCHTAPAVWRHVQFCPSALVQMRSSSVG